MAIGSSAPTKTGLRLIRSEELSVTIEKLGSFEPPRNPARQRGHGGKPGNRSTTMPEAGSIAATRALPRHASAPPVRSTRNRQIVAKPQSSQRRVTGVASITSLKRVRRTPATKIRAGSATANTSDAKLSKCWRVGQLREQAARRDSSLRATPETSRAPRPRAPERPRARRSAKGRVSRETRGRYDGVASMLNRGAPGLSMMELPRQNASP